MTEKEQIEEMIKELCDGYGTKCGVCSCKPCAFIEHCKSLYNAGYRKQIVGEWIERDCITESKRGRTIHYSTQKCSVCGKWNGRHKANYCPYCGAKMKGGAE